MDVFAGLTGALLAALLLTSFIKILTALNILRYGMGLSDAPFGFVIVGMSVALSLVVMNPQHNLSAGQDQAQHGTAETVEAEYRPFLEKHAEKKTIDGLLALQQKVAKSGSPGAVAAARPDAPFPVLIAAFLVSELTSAFSIGVLFLVPFIVIDLAVANLLMALGATQISQHVVALPLKLLLFVAINGWQLVAEKLLGSYL
jgi:flagellar biosynthesis protein FliP